MVLKKKFIIFLKKTPKNLLRILSESDILSHQPLHRFLAPTHRAAGTHRKRQVTAPFQYSKFPSSLNQSHPIPMSLSLSLSFPFTSSETNQTSPHNIAY